ncbi:MAG: rhomboid family intramembrane serine protease [Fuerstiella sp.]
MLIPLSTDAPIYHYPIATVGMIVVNIFCYLFAGPADPDTMWMLHYGTINPIEWLLSMFMHADFIHLAGNMFFLWAFGLIVEGKLGWRRFIGVYLLIGLSQCAIEQTIMLHRTEARVLQNTLEVDSRDELVECLLAEDPELTNEEAEEWADLAIAGLRGASCGASSVIFGLLAICMVWAPKNEFHVLLFIMFRAISFDVTILWYSVWYIGWELVMFAIGGFGVSSAALHVMGAAVGFGIGVLYVKKDWVDCENWDLFKVLTGKYGRFADPSTTVGSHADPTLMFGQSSVAVQDDLPKKKKPPTKSSRLQRVNELIDGSSMMEASEELFALQMHDETAKLDQTRLKRLALGLVQLSMSDEAEIYLEEYIERFPDDAAVCRLKLAEIELQQHRPAAALATLKGIRLSKLTEAQQKMAKKVAGSAKKQVQDGVEDAEREW